LQHHDALADTKATLVAYPQAGKRPACKHLVEEGTYDEQTAALVTPEEEDYLPAAENRGAPLCPMNGKKWQSRLVYSGGGHSRSPCPCPACGV